MPNTVVITPISLWMYLLVAIPFLYIIVISFMNKGTYGGVVLKFTIQNYLDILNPLYIRTFLKSIGMSVAVTLICLLIAYPFTYFVAKKNTDTKDNIYVHDHDSLLREYDHTSFFMGKHFEKRGNYQQFSDFCRTDKRTA